MSSGSAVEAETREHVVEVADALYYARGVQAVGMDDLRSASGLSLRRLYGLFPSKESIVLEVLRRRHELWTSTLAAAVSAVAAEGPRAQLLATYDYLAVWFDDDDFRGCGFINTFGELGAASPAVAAAAREHKASFQAYMASLVDAAGGSADLAAQLAILAEGAQTTAAIAGTGEAAGQARRAAATLIDAALG
ncbi:TetR/AcrR family transcriptional regulator [Schumannella luteola]|uniref:AcrR family transcriptional regulator n=1 Tax=Schumannella luteola TaxID=472059 RepID=A0A852Y6F4_9MICO|nr:TetR family transcriptional regulator [Schumannella luteola]NYG98536.1 AcrR family transcriptional regulator [Schumannella luteola]TPX01243.1 TetR/AcrR family transcriptional regulator [Schumannella luteola]